jgi:single-strand DNA-binding protein
MYETPITVQGRLVADPVVKQGRNGPFTTLRVAQSERHPKRGEPGQWVDSEASYYDVTTYRGMGENAARCLRKGQPVVVTGKLRVRDYQRPDGSWGKAVEIDASALGHDLRWGVTSFIRNGDLEPVLPAPAPHNPGDPERDPYTVEEEPGLLGSAASAPASGGSGPLVPPADGEAA